MSQQTEQSAYTLVVGLGKTGLSVVRHLFAQGVAVRVADSRDIPPGLDQLKSACPGVICYTGKFDHDVFINAERIIASPGVPLGEPALQAAAASKVSILGDIDLFAEQVTAPVIGITGSNGKSTVTALLEYMARQDGLNAVACGNYGLPVLDALDSKVELYLLELSSFQLETLQRLDMKSAVVLNISADHLDRYASLEDYADSKQRIYRHAETCVVNLDDRLAMKQSDSDSCIGFSLAGATGSGFEICNNQVCLDGNALISVDDIAIKGTHNLQNAMAALALGMAAGLSMPSMLASLETFAGLPHRLQLAGELNRVRFYNDSKATNVGASIASMQGLPGKHILLAGGIAKDADFSPLRDVVATHCRAVVLFGQDASSLQACMPADMNVQHADSMQQAVAQAVELAQAGDNVLLAPACASFDMFDNFEHRGDTFMRIVHDMIAAHGSSGVQA